jgi:hypothetical protein
MTGTIGIKGLERQEEIVTDYFDDKESFSPEKAALLMMRK